MDETRVPKGRWVEPDEMIEISPLRGWVGRAMHGEHLTIVRWDIAADAADLHEHHQPQEEVWEVLDGEIDLVIDGVCHRVRAGAGAVVAPNLPHRAIVRGACVALVVNHPRRDPLPTGSPARAGVSADPTGDGRSGHAGADGPRPT